MLSCFTSLKIVVRRFSFRIFFRANSHYVKSVSETEIILISGPTASGKSALALELAEKLRGVIINAELHAGLSRPACHHRATDDEGRAARATPSLWPRRCGGKLFRRALARGRRSDAQIDKALWACRHRRRRYRPLFDALTRGLAEVPPIPAEVLRGARRRWRPTVRCFCITNSRNAIRPRRRG